MIVLDANVLLYAHVPSFPQHKAAAAWIEETLSEGKNSVAIIWQVATAFLRISTNARIFDKPFDIATSINCLNELFTHPLVQQLGPTERHWGIYSAILVDQNLTGDIIMDAHIAATAIEHGAAIASTDRNFRRFAEYVKVINPLAK